MWQTVFLFRHTVGNVEDKISQDQRFCNLFENGQVINKLAQYIMCWVIINGKKGKYGGIYEVWGWLLILEVVVKEGFTEEILTQD